MKQFVKVLDKDGPCFMYIWKAFPALSDEKLKTGVFDISQIRKLIQDKEFVKAMNAIESSHLLKWYVQKFLGNHKAPNYKCAQILWKTWNQREHQTTLPLQSSRSLPSKPWWFQRWASWTISSRHKSNGRKVPRKRGQHMMTEYCWNFLRDCPDVHLSRKSYKRKFLCAK